WPSSASAWCAGVCGARAAKPRSSDNREDRRAMNSKTLISLAAFVVLGIGAFIALRRPEVGERTGDKPRPFPKIAAGDVDTVEVTRNSAVTTVIKKEGGKYKVTSPVAYAADENFAKSAFEAIEKLEFGSLVTEQKTKQAEFEVEDGKTVHVVAK